ncbi:hypothetical protein LPJ66_007536 [Kickxella alabastrina]|uniref:Uncharacterized protein n=1 Tax=Kickxella alabastrina TaxID=61397 RepID=A0ACC1IGX6_9FUNG|nr:hypothetical protein LPJ66_007536 [Kickxella alabastrina]
MTAYRSSLSKVALAAMALVQAVSCVLYIPTTSIEDTSAYYEAVSNNWSNVHSQLQGQLDEYSKEKNYGAYVVMESIYGATIPKEYNEEYLSSLMGKLNDVGTYTWDGKELESMSETYQQAHGKDNSIESEEGGSSGNGAGARAWSSWTGSIVLGCMALAMVAL